MSYNAVLRKENGEVVGRVLLSNLLTLPRKWEIIYGEDFIPKTTDLKTLLCYNKFPLSVYTVPVHREITVKSLQLQYGYAFKDLEPFSVSKDTDLMVLKKYIFDLAKKKKDDFGFEDVALYHDHKLLQDSKTIEEFVFTRKYTLRVEIVRKEEQSEYDDDRLLPDTWSVGGGGPLPGFYAVNLKAEQVEGKGVPVRNDWEGYSYGLTIYGTCPKQSCPSHKIPLKQTSYRDGYGILRIDMNRRTFHCPACASEFPPANFVVCNARALFRFKKTGSHLEVETSLLQSFGGIDEYIKFNNGGEGVEYDWIEVKTVKKDESVNIGSRCDLPIKMKVDAVLFDCGHPVHRSCLGDECGICNAPSLSQKEVDTLANRATGKSMVTKAGPSGTCRKRKRQ